MREFKIERTGTDLFTTLDSMGTVFFYDSVDLTLTLLAQHKMPELRYRWPFKLKVYLKMPRYSDVKLEYDSFDFVTGALAYRVHSAIEGLPEFCYLCKDHLLCELDREKPPLWIYVKAEPLKRKKVDERKQSAV